MRTLRLLLPLLAAGLVAGQEKSAPPLPVTRTLQAHVGKVEAGAFTPDGKYLATVCASGFYLWDATSGDLLDRVPLALGRAPSLAAHPVERRFAVTAAQDGLPFRRPDDPPPAVVVYEVG